MNGPTGSRSLRVAVDARSPSEFGFGKRCEARGRTSWRRTTGPVPSLKNWLDWLELWETYRTGFDELIDVGDRVVILLRDHGRRKDMDEEVEQIGATILTFREGKVARWEDYADRADALEAAGHRE